MATPLSDIILHNVPTWFPIIIFNAHTQYSYLSKLSISLCQSRVCWAIIRVSTTSLVSKFSIRVGKMSTPSSKGSSGHKLESSFWSLQHTPLSPPLSPAGVLPFSCTVQVMPGPSKNPWSNSPNAPQIPYEEYFQEKTILAGLLIGAISYGKPTLVSVYSCSPGLF